MNTDSIERKADAEIQIAHFLATQIQNATSYFGYPEVPENNDLGIMGISGIAKLHLNNAGDPWAHGNAKMHTKEFEKEVLSEIAKLYGISENFWGYVTSGGTEGNLYGQYLGRELHEKSGKQPVLLYSSESHYSIAKNAKLLGLEAREIQSQSSGEIDYEHFSTAVADLKSERKSMILNLNIGTTMHGAIDSLIAINERLDAIGFAKEDRIIHADAALMGLIYPFTKNAVDLFGHGVHSLSLSGHKFLGAIHPCGILLAEKSIHEKAFGDAWVSYVGSNDTTISGSRNGFLALNLWYLLKTKGIEGYKSEALTCIENANYLRRELQKIDYPEVSLFPNQTIVTFKEPSKALISKYQLATSRNMAHVVVMQHITKNRIDGFVADMKADFESR